MHIFPGRRLDHDEPAGSTVSETNDPAVVRVCRLGFVAVANHGLSAVPGCGTYWGKSLHATASRSR
jgi:hypothetical protein